jgi:isopentenyl diphosphate isomerase/L-lactate dehydrogenase-like FMN-dependent dehydrogenase
MDAKRAADLGIEGIVLSNHGGSHKYIWRQGASL